MREKFRISNNYIKTFCLLLVLSLLYVLPIIIANRCYNDDLIRTLEAVTGWKGDGRFLTQVLVEILGGFSKYAIDVAPLPLLISVFLLSYSLILYGQNVLNYIKNEFILLMLLLLFVVHPFLISVFQFKYDVIGMISALCVILLLYAFNNSNIIHSAIYGCICSIVAMLLYQPVIGDSIGFFLLGLYLFLIEKREKEYLWGDLFKTFGCIVGAVIYKLCIASLLIKDIEGDWRYAASQTVSITDASLIPKVIDGYKKITNTIIDYFYNGSSKISFGVLVFLLSFAIIGTVVKVWSSGKGKYSNIYQIIRIIFIVALPFLLIIGTFGPLTILPNIATYGRFYLAFGVIALYFGISLVYAIGDRITISILVLSIVLLQRYSFMYMVGNASNSQKEYETYLAYGIAKDIEEIEMIPDIEDYDATKLLSIVGKTPFAPEAAMLIDKYPVLDNFVPVYITNSGWLGGAWLNHYLHTPIGFSEASQEEIDSLDNLEPIKTNSIYSIYLLDDKMLLYYHYDD